MPDDAPRPEPVLPPAFSDLPPNRLMGPGHAAGDFLRAPEWEVVEEREGFLRISAAIPDHVLNPKGELFGGFTPTYVDLVSLFTVRAGGERLSPSSSRGWLTTLNMRIDYYEPVTAGTIELVGERVHQRGLTSLVTARFHQHRTLAVHALTTLRAVPDPLSGAG